MKVWFGALGGLVGLVLSGMIKDKAGFAVMALSMSCFALTFRYLGMAGIWNYASRTDAAGRPAALPAPSRRRSATGRSCSFLPSFVLFQLSYWLMSA